MTSPSVSFLIQPSSLMRVPKYSWIRAKVLCNAWGLTMVKKKAPCPGRPTFAILIVKSWCRESKSNHRETHPVTLKQCHPD